MCRVRHHDTLARVELGRDELARAIEPEMSAAIVADLKAAGYQFVCFSGTGEGYRTRSLNEILTLRPDPNRPTACANGSFPLLKRPRSPDAAHRARAARRSYHMEFDRDAKSVAEPGRWPDFGCAHGNLTATIVANVPIKDLKDVEIALWRVDNVFRDLILSQRFVRSYR